MTTPEVISELLAGIEDGSAVLMDADGLALQIQDQNTRYNEAGEIFKDDPEILEIVRSDIADEQEETYANILAIQPESNCAFENLGKLSLAVYAATEHVDVQLSTIDAKLKEQEKFLEEQLELKAQLITDELLVNVERLAPRAVPAVRELLKTRGHRYIRDEKIEELEDAILGLMEQQDEAEQDAKKIKALSDKFAAVIGGLSLAWDLPLALVGQNRSVFAAIDELPVEPMPVSYRPKEIKKIRENHIDQPEAALYAALCLCEHSGQTVTVDQIAKALYSSDVIASLSEYHLRARVTTTLGPQLRGENIRAILDDEGYILQYGWRRILEKKGTGRTAVVRRERIYRAIPKDHAAAFIGDRLFEGEGYEDSYEELRICEEVLSPQLPAGTGLASVEPDGTSVVGASRIDVYQPQNSRNETNARRRERAKNELFSSITRPARGIIKTLEEYGTLQDGKIKLVDLRDLFDTISIGDDDVLRIVGSGVKLHDSFWLNIVDAVRLMLSVSLEDETARTNVSSNQWSIIVNEKINELIERELRGVQRRELLKAR